MAIGSLPTEILQEIAVYLPSFAAACNNAATPWPQSVVEFEPNLRSLCATSRQLRSVYLPFLYRIVVVHVPYYHRPSFETRYRDATAFFRKSDPAVLRLIRAVHLHCHDDPSQKATLGRRWQIDPSATPIAECMRLLLRDVLECASCLRSFRFKDFNSHLDEISLSAVNSHPSLETVSVPHLNSALASSLATKRLSSVSLSRAHCREAFVSRFLAPDAVETLARRHISITRLFVVHSQAPFPHGSAVTIRGLEILAYSAGCEDLARHSDAFLSRHPLLRNITIQNIAPLDLVDVPMCASVYDSVSRRDLYLCFRVQSIHLVRGPQAGNFRWPDTERLFMMKMWIIIEDRTAEVIPCILGNVPPCAQLYLDYDGDDGRDRDTVAPVWDSVLDSAPNLQYLVYLQLTVPFDDGKDGQLLLSDDMNAMYELGVRLTDGIQVLVKRCPRLSTVIISQPLGYEDTQKFLRFTVPQRLLPQKSDCGEADGGDGGGSRGEDGEETLTFDVLGRAAWSSLYS